MRLPIVCLLVLAMAGCDVSAPRPEAEHRRTAEVVSVGHPVPPVPIEKPVGGTIELRASGGWFAARLDPPPGRPHDACVLVGLRKSGPLEADTLCEVLGQRAAASMIQPLAAGVVLVGVAPQEVRAVRLVGPDGARTLPLSPRRTFLAVFPPKAKGRIRIVSDLQHGATVRSFSLPLPRRWSLRLHHRHRRPGAVFPDEIGEPIVQLSYAQVVVRFGPPAVVRREQGLRCAYYEVVGFVGDSWKFCFRASGRMKSAAGGRPPPQH